MVRLTLLLALAALTACAANTLPEAHGPWHQLNEGKWSFNENALIDPPTGLSR